MDGGNRDLDGTGQVVYRETDMEINQIAPNPALDLTFSPFPKITRYNREWVITEKIDGTNGLIRIFEDPRSGHDGISPYAPIGAALDTVHTVERSGRMFGIMAGSRNRFLTPDDDNFGFCRWVRNNAHELIGLGIGHHYGEWWGSGIQRRYGLDHKRFSLFNTARWHKGPQSPVGSIKSTNPPECCGVVPVISCGLPASDFIQRAIDMLRGYGSLVAPGFMKPEGIVVIHAPSRHQYKITLENDDAPKGSVGSVE